MAFCIYSLENSKYFKILTEWSCVVDQIYIVRELILHNPFIKKEATINIVKIRLLKTSPRAILLRKLFFSILHILLMAYSNFSKKVYKAYYSISSIVIFQMYYFQYMSHHYSKKIIPFCSASFSCAQCHICLVKDINLEWLLRCQR